MALSKGNSRQERMRFFFSMLLSATLGAALYCGGGYAFWVLNDAAAWLMGAVTSLTLEVVS